MAIRFGHIDYSNCVPVHAELLARSIQDIEVVRGVPTRLNRALADGEIDVAPCSSIEYARHAGDYRILPHFAIGSHGAVRSIILEATCTPEQLHGRTVAVPTASATSIALLRILLELRWGVRAEFVLFDQALPADPIADGAAAALRIGDVALTRRVPPARTGHDLGRLWHEWTGLPFAFAVWQVRADLDTRVVACIIERLRHSRAWFLEHEHELARSHAPGFGLAPDALLDYWHSLHFALDTPMQQGLLHFFRLAARLGEAPPVDSLRIAGAAY